MNPVAASGNAELDELKQQLNDIRAKRSLAPLTFSAERQTQAKAIAGKFAETECSYASLRRILAEEKAPIAVYFASGFSRTDGTYAAQELTPRFVAFEWSDGERQYDADAGACRNGDACASYGAIVRQSASDVGCARHTCGNQSQVWVCSVGP